MKTKTRLVFISVRQYISSLLLSLVSQITIKYNIEKNKPKPKKRSTALPRLAGQECLVALGSWSSNRGLGLISTWFTRTFASAILIVLVPMSGQAVRAHTRILWGTLLRWNMTAVDQNRTSFTIMCLWMSVFFFLWWRVNLECLRHNGL